MFIPEAYLEPFQTSTMELFAKIALLAKSAILDVLQVLNVANNYFTLNFLIHYQHDIIITCLLSDDHSRVILSNIENEVGSTYINGNFIDVRHAALVDTQPRLNVIYIASTR